MPERDIVGAVAYREYVVERVGIRELMQKYGAPPSVIRYVIRKYARDNGLPVPSVCTRQPGVDTDEATRRDPAPNQSDLAKRMRRIARNKKRRAACSAFCLAHWEEYRSVTTRADLSVRDMYAWRRRRVRAMELSRRYGVHPAEVKNCLSHYKVQRYYECQHPPPTGRPRTGRPPDPRITAKRDAVYRDYVGLNEEGRCYKTAELAVKYQSTVSAIEILIHEKRKKLLGERRAARASQFRDLLREINYSSKPPRENP